MNGGISLGIGFGITHLRQQLDPDFTVSNLELEDGNDLLLESGDFILLE